MKLRQLQFFIAVAEELSFSRAAIKLHVAQPSLSTQIQALEDEVGARLFERDKRHVSLTPAGRRFQAGCARQRHHYQSTPAAGSRGQSICHYRGK